jgi:N-acetylneuraminate synthase
LRGGRYRLPARGNGTKMAESERDHVEIICEAGVNHNGALPRAVALVDAAATAGADVVKFQTYRTESIVTQAAPKAAYQNRNAPETASQFEMLKALELDAAAHRALITRARERGIRFLSTPFDLPSLRLLTELGLTRLKISSGDLTNAPLLLEMARSGADLILSTGMADLAEIGEALSILAFGYICKEQPGRPGFAAAFDSDAGQTALRRHVTLLHCTSDYPAQVADVNLRAMDTLAATFGLPVGYSDHTAGIEIAIAAAARGARVIEKHMTLDKNLPGPDHKASLEPAEFAAMVAAIRAVSRSLGSAEKKPSAAEMSTRQVARKAIVAAQEIAAGETFSLENLTTKRAGGGRAPVTLWDLLGTQAKRAYAPDEAIEP